MAAAEEVPVWRGTVERKRVNAIVPRVAEILGLGYVAVQLKRFFIPYYLFS